MKQQKQLAALVVLLVIAGSVWYWFFFRQKTVAPVGAVAVAQNYNRLLSVPNPEPHTDRREAARKAVYKSNGRNPFSAIAPSPLQTPDHVAPTKEPSGPKVEPPPPPVEIPANMHFFGYGTVPNGTSRRAFFTDGEDVYVVSEGEVFLNRFRILKVNNASLDFEEISSGRHGTKALEEQPASPSV